MFSNLTIKAKLIASFAIVSILIIGLSIFSVTGINKSSNGFSDYREMARDSVLAGMIQSNMLMVRMNVKDYLTTKSQKDINEFNEYFEKTMKLVNNAKKEIKDPQRLSMVSKIQDQLTSYKQHFNEVISFMNKRDDIKTNILDMKGKKIEQLLTSVMNTAKKDKDYTASLESCVSLRSLLLSRLYTAKFLDSNSNEDFNRVNQEFDDLEKEIASLRKEIQNKARIANLNEAVTLIGEYKQGVKDIHHLIIDRNKIINEKLNIIGPNIAKLSDDVKLSIKKDQDTIGPEVSSINTTLQSSSIIVSLIIVLIIIIIAVIIPRSIALAIKGLNDGILNLLTSKDVSSRVEVKSKDEIGEVTTNFNKYLQSIEDGIQDDKKLIDEAKIVISRVKHGWYSQTIEGTTSNTSLEEFKNGVNDMINATKEHFINMNVILEQYAKYDYRNELKLEGIEKGGVFEVLINDINKLRGSINEMLRNNKQNGMTLEKSSDILLKNVDTLNQNSNEAAAALEETAAALEEVTGNVTSTTENVVQMAQYASNVTSASKIGEKLASDTTKAMDEINTEVTSINEAISVIDQIAFQTNILSLNAAVEAATAGEAGKGFAVVAQEVRNLASRSAEAAGEIKSLVENATNKANSGKKIADEMIQGYNGLNESIRHTTELIQSVETASQEQKTGIVQINDAINSLDQQTQQNAMIASQTQSVAIQTDSLAKLIVQNANESEFTGKNEVKAKDINLSDAKPQITKENKQVSKETNAKPNVQKEIKKTTEVKKITSNTSDDEWESF